MSTLRNLMDQRFGRLVVIARALNRNGVVFWRCQCDCGQITDINAANLAHGKVRSCGCLRREFGKDVLSKLGAESNVTHGLARRGSRHPLFDRWIGMWSRCTNPNHGSFSNYGGRGVTVCERWRDFALFLADVEMPDDDSLSLERKENSGNYEPGNVVWATPAEQSRNTRRTRFLTLDGRSQCATDWANELGLNRATIYGRLRRGLSDSEALAA